MKSTKQIEMEVVVYIKRTNIRYLAGKCLNTQFIYIFRLLNVLLTHHQDIISTTQP